MRCGLPYVAAAVVFLLRRHLARPLPQRFTYALAVWIASAALLIPGRGGSPHTRYGAAYADGRLLGYGWAAGFLAVFATLVVVTATFLILRATGRTPTKRGLHRLSLGIGAAGALPAAAGLVLALVGPMP